jgi:phage tail protein X
MRVRAAKDDHMGLAGEDQVVGVATLTTQEHGVFLAWDGLSDREPVLGPGLLVSMPSLSRPSSISGPTPFSRAIAPRRAGRLF